MVQLIHRGRLPGLLVAKGIIEAANFPPETKIGEPTAWNAIVHNIGADGRIAIGIANESGNPGNITVTWKGSDIKIPPGYYLRIYTINPMPNCYRIDESGSAAFSGLGNYNISVLALHEENTSWVIDDLRSFVVIVTEAPPPPLPSLWDQIIKAWNGLAGYQKALIVGTPILGATVIVAKPFKKR